MASLGYLLGHFECLDWRPLQFVDLPSTISCDLCGVIPDTLLRLECYHWLCEFCYQSLVRGYRQCPLDKQPFRESEVVSLPIRLKRLHKLDVHCCNSNHGCDFVGPLEDMKTHFSKDCEFHVLACKRCRSPVLRRDIVAHYMEEQCGARTGLTSAEVVGSDDNLANIAREIHASLADTADKLRAIEDRLNTQTEGIAATKSYVVSNAQSLRTIKEGQNAASDVLTRMRAVLASIEEQHGNQALGTDVVKNMVTANSQTLTTLLGLQNVLAISVERLSDDWKRRWEKLLSISGTNGAFFHVQGVSELVQQAKEGTVVANMFSDVFELSGYSARLGVEFEEHNKIVCIGVFLHICNSSRDSLLKWPFVLPYSLLLVHPFDEEKNLEYRVDVLRTSDRVPACFNRPVSRCSNGVGNPKLCKLEDALNDGFVHENAITVGVTLLDTCS